MMFLKGQIASKQGAKEEAVLALFNEAVQIRLGQLDVSNMLHNNGKYNF